MIISKLRYYDVKDARTSSSRRGTIEQRKTRFRRREQIASSVKQILLFNNNQTESNSVVALIDLNVVVVGSALKKCLFMIGCLFSDII